MLNKIPRNYVFKKLEKISTKWNKKETRLTRMLAFPTPKGMVFGFPRAWYTHFTNVMFENREFMAISEYKEYLTYKYGDYMELPPPEKRHWHPAAKLRLPEDY